jgi:pimeloyl-ACP methyl ester carboxylesterase
MTSRLPALLLTAVGLALPGPALALCRVSACSPDGEQSSGALYRICMPEPECWNGDLVIWAHGYVAEGEPLAIRGLELPGGPSLPELVNALGFAFATTSYRQNGLAVKEGIEDLEELVAIFGREQQRSPDRVYVIGASQGGLIGALAAERHPEVFDGALAACGPIGDFQRQIDYVGDFRVVFDYFFPGVIPGSPIDIPEAVIASWEAVYVPRIAAALAANPARRDQLLRVTRAALDPLDPGTRERTAIALLWYNVFGTNDAARKLGGQPFDNRLRLYRGSSNDFALNLRVRRFTADAAARNEIEANYQTEGTLLSPVVTMHTTGDPIIPYWHEPLYALKTWMGRSASNHLNLPVARHGHCTFKPAEALLGFAALVLKVRGQELAGADKVLADAAERQGARPTGPFGGGSPVFMTVGPAGDGN